MKILVFINQLGLGGTEKAASLWAIGLRKRGYEVTICTLKDGLRRFFLEAEGLEVQVVETEVRAIQDTFRSIKPDIIHTHAPGYPQIGDILGYALIEFNRKIPVVQTNVFGRLENHTENQWTDFRLFVSWTSAVQAARRSFQKLDKDFFKKASVAVNPLDPDDGPSLEEIKEFRSQISVETQDFLLGRFSRPDMSKWTDLPIQAFRRASAEIPNLKLLLREPPEIVAQHLRNSSDHKRFIILPATTDVKELRLTQASVDAVLHASLIGESFGYGIAEVLNYGKPAIANSTPLEDQAQIELIKPGRGGFITGTVSTTAQAIQKLQKDDLRIKMGTFAQFHIRQLANPQHSLDQLEMALKAAITNTDNPCAEADAVKAQKVAAELDHYQFGAMIEEKMTLMPSYYKARLRAWLRFSRKKYGLV